MPLCVFCKNKIELSYKPGRNEECPHCKRAVHCCLQCKFYDKTAHHECREPQAEYVREKDQPNYCDYFVFEPQGGTVTDGTAGAAGSLDAARAKLDALFKKK